ncbi:MAG: nucleotidyltransferase domain-containing protein [Betaproteobacteria bacterium]
MQSTPLVALEAHLRRRDLPETFVALHAPVPLGPLLQQRGGTHLLYGSAARGGFGARSDVDVAVDFPRALEADAVEFAERMAARSGLVQGPIAAQCAPRRSPGYRWTCSTPASARCSHWTPRRARRPLP